MWTRRATLRGGRWTLMLSLSVAALVAGYGLVERRTAPPASHAMGGAVTERPQSSAPWVERPASRILGSGAERAPPLVASADPGPAQAVAESTLLSEPPTDDADTQLLVTTLRDDPVPGNRLAAVDRLRVMGRQGDREGRIQDSLRAAMNDKDPTVAINARDALSEILN